MPLILRALPRPHPTAAFSTAMTRIMLATALLLSLPTAFLSLPAAASGQGAESSDNASSPIERSRSHGLSPEYEGKLPTLSAINLRTATLRRLDVELEEPWAFEFLQADEILVTERKARLLRITLDDPPRVIEIEGLPQITTSHQQTGLLDVELHPDFNHNRRIYFSYVSADAASGNYYLTAVATATLAGDRLDNVQTLIEAGPHGWSPSNFGGALEFLGDGTLLVSVGDRSEEVLAQRGDRLQGKILRLAADGSVAGDNPFINDAQVDDRIWALGLRNVQGLVRDPVSGNVYATSHGPLGGDEVNWIRAGKNYGWPTVTYGRNYSTARIGTGTHAPGVEQPLFYYLPSEAISPLAIYRGELFSDWDGDLLVGALKGKHVSRLDLDGTVVRSEYPILSEINDRIRDIRVAHDGTVWILGQTTGLWQLGLDPEPPLPDAPAGGAAVYGMACAGCHDAGVGDAPTLDAGCRWDVIAGKGREKIYTNVRQGIGNMPERGLCYLCEDQHLQAAVDFMLNSAADCEFTD